MSDTREYPDPGSAFRCDHGIPISEACHRCATEAVALEMNRLNNEHTLPTLTFALQPPRLKQRIREYGIAMPTFAPIFDRIFVCPTDKQDLPETTGASKIIMPESTRARLGAQRGVLIAAGPIAIEQLYGHGISLGDIVLCARFSPWDRAYMGVKPGEDAPSLHRMMIMRAAEVVGSEDLLTALESGELRMDMDTEGRVSIHDRQRVDPPTNDEGI